MGSYSVEVPITVSWAEGRLTFLTGWQYETETSGESHERKIFIFFQISLLRFSSRFSVTSGQKPRKEAPRNNKTRKHHLWLKLWIALWKEPAPVTQARLWIPDICWHGSGGPSEGEFWWCFLPLSLGIYLTLSLPRRTSCQEERLRERLSGDLADQCLCVHPCEGELSSLSVTSWDTAAGPCSDRSIDEKSMLAKRRHQKSHNNIKSTTTNQKATATTMLKLVWCLRF